MLCAGCGGQEAVIQSKDGALLDANMDVGTFTQNDTEYASQETKISESSEDPQMCAVYVCGAVKSPGVYYLTPGSIKQDALMLAGGFHDGAAEWYVNLAEAAKDGERIYVPYESELKKDGVPSDIVKQAGDTVTGVTDSGNLGDSGSLVNINKASKEELMTISGIGESRAEAIIKYRTENGAFADISDICKVSGIKEGLYGRIKDYITVN